MTQLDKANLGKPIPADFAHVERDLANLWQQAAGQEHSIVRACASNLVVLADTAEEAQAFTPVLRSVAEWHPSRAVIAYRESDEACARRDPHLHTWISAQCSAPPSGGQAICCEVITLAARGIPEEDLPNSVISLIVPDLPVFFYWRSFKPGDTGLVRQLSRFLNLVIVDSHSSKDDPENRRQLLEFLISIAGPVAVRDLNWARLTAWRELIAQFFDPPSQRRLVREIERVEICRALAAPGSIPTRTLLLSGWLASRLGWKRISARRTDDLWVSHWEQPGGRVELSFRPAATEPGTEAGITGITMKTRTGVVFSVRRRDRASCVTATAEGIGDGVVHSVPQENLDEASLLVRELTVTGEDVSFARALAEAVALEKSFRQGA